MSLLPLKLKRRGLSYFSVIQYNEGKNNIKKKYISCYFARHNSSDLHFRVFANHYTKNNVFIRFYLE